MFLKQFLSISLYLPLSSCEKYCFLIPGVSSSYFVISRMLGYDKQTYIRKQTSDVITHRPNESFTKNLNSHDNDMDITTGESRYVVMFLAM